MSESGHLNPCVRLFVSFSCFGFLCLFLVDFYMILICLICAVAGSRENKEKCRWCVESRSVGAEERIAAEKEDDSNAAADHSARQRDVQQGELSWITTTLSVTKARFPLPEFTGRVDGPWTRVHFWHRLTRAVNSGVKKCTRVHGTSTWPVNSGSGNWALTLHTIPWGQYSWPALRSYQFDVICFSDVTRGS